MKRQPTKAGKKHKPERFNAAEFSRACSGSLEKSGDPKASFNYAFGRGKKKP